MVDATCMGMPMRHGCVTMLIVILFRAAASEGTGFFLDFKKLSRPASRPGDSLLVRPVNVPALVMALTPASPTGGGTILDIPYPGSDGDPEEGKDDHDNCTEQTSDSTDDDGENIIPDIGFPCVLHQVEIIHDEEGDESNYRVDNQVHDVLDDKYRDQHEDNNEQDEESGNSQRHLFPKTLPR